MTSLTADCPPSHARHGSIVFKQGRVCCKKCLLWISPRYLRRA